MFHSVRNINYHEFHINYALIFIRRNTIFFIEHGRHEKTKEFRLFCEFRVLKKNNVLINVSLRLFRNTLIRR